MRSLFAILLLLLAGAVEADERILSFDSEIWIESDGSLFVTESIQVSAEGREIRRGIYRDFPTVYRDALGNRITVPFDVASVTRDGNPEPWHTERVTGGTRLYIGQASTFLEPGEYAYRIEYTTDRQLGYFDDHDELYWNIIGNDWMFPIDAVTASVRLPGDVARENLRIDAYPRAPPARPVRPRVVVADRPAAGAEAVEVAVGSPHRVCYRNCADRTPN